jgi:hypothetical protein
MGVGTTSLSLSLSHTHTHTLTLTLSHSLTHSLSLTHTHTFSLTLLLRQHKYRVHGVAAGAASVLSVDGEAGAVGAVVRVGHREAARGRSAVVRGASRVSVARERGRLVLQLADVVAEDKISRDFWGAPGLPRSPARAGCQKRRQKRVCVTRSPGAHTWHSADSAESGNNIGSIWEAALGKRGVSVYALSPHRYEERKQKKL